MTRGVLVTGGAQGIGEAITRAFLAQGDLVLVVDRDAQALRSLTGEYGDAVRTLSGDVQDDDLMARAVRDIVEVAGSLDVAVNNAGLAGPHRPLPEFSRADFSLIMGVNVGGVFTGMRHEIPQMQAQGAGAIINTASALGLVGAANQSVYAASKHAIVGLTKSAALDVAGSGIRINCVCPGVIESPLSRAAIEADPELGGTWAALHPIGRLGQPAEVAAAVLWLADPASSFVTGTALSVDGGYTTR